MNDWLVQEFESRAERVMMTDSLAEGLERLGRTVSPEQKVVEQRQIAPPTDPVVFDRSEMRRLMLTIHQLALMGKYGFNESWPDDARKGMWQTVNQTALVAWQVVRRATSDDDELTIMGMETNRMLDH